MRIAARLGLRFSKETEAAILDLSSSIQSLGKDRFMMEMNFMMAHGAAASSINLLQIFKLLESIFPAHLLREISQENVVKLVNILSLHVSFHGVGDCSAYARARYPE
ncbi:hypothetical protein KSP39_PZI000770 [Platanthera zijinensis]|uniref:tRNA nucleotidyltransferase/poly(A) polymerase RNA and SrmB- binding domain-containing protein n=1 Tax=Platanthera zijinensis TaxID=2320716 RepID=A0AAP0GFG1_9ASPA